MKKLIFYVVTNRDVVTSNNEIDLGVSLEKIVLSSDSEDFKSYCGGDDLDLWEDYVDDFIFHFNKTLENEKTMEGRLWVYDSILLWETQYKMLSRLMKQDVVEREVNVCELLRPTWKIKNGKFEKTRREMV